MVTIISGDFCYVLYYSMNAQDTCILKCIIGNKLQRLQKKIEVKYDHVSIFHIIEFPCSCN